MNFTHYLPNTEKRLNKLRRIINQRTVAILVHGVSIAELEKRITELKDCDICYCSTDRFWLMNKYILSQINRSLSINACSAVPEKDRGWIIPFLEKRENNMLISIKRAFDQGEMNNLIDKYDRKLLFHDIIYGPGYQEFFEVPNQEYPLHFPLLNSLSDLICLSIIGGASRIVLFGADGGRISKSSLYYRESEYDTGGDLDLIHDTLQLNMVMNVLLGRVYNTYNLALIDIVNCSPQSHYDVFRKLSYDETFELLRGSK